LLAGDVEDLKEFAHVCRGLLCAKDSTTSFDRLKNLLRNFQNKSLRDTKLNLTACGTRAASTVADLFMPFGIDLLLKSTEKNSYFVSSPLIGEG
jgi:hypothetical protein